LETKSRLGAVLLFCAELVIADWPNTTYREGFREDYPEWAAHFGTGEG